MPKKKKGLSDNQIKTMRSKCLPQTKAKLKKGFVGAPLSYTKLMVRMFNKEDTVHIQRSIVECNNPTKAKDLVHKSCWLFKPNQIGYRHWCYRDLSLLQNWDCGILMYKTVAVLLFFKRQIATIVPDPIDPVPEGTLDNEDDVWATLDLFSKSHTQLHGNIKKEFEQFDSEIASLKMQLASSQVLLEAAQGQIKSLTTQLKFQPKGKKDNGKANGRCKNGKANGRCKEGIKKGIEEKG